MVTIFENAKSTKNPYYITIDKALNRIKSGASKEAVERIREKFRNGEDYANDKIMLPSVIFAGQANKESTDSYGNTTYRNDECVTTHSGFFVIDFDNTDTEIVKARLKADSHIYAVWAGVTKGAKALVKCPPNIEKHGEYYNAFLSKYPELDPTSKNIGRLCFESYDPDIHINKSSVVFDTTMTTEEYEAHKVNLKDKKKKRILDIAVSMINSSKVGERHDVILRAATLCGGYHRFFNGDEAVERLKMAVKAKGFPANELPIELKAVVDGYAHGKSLPLQDIKEIERSVDFTRREDGTYDFLADESEMDDYEYRVITGTLEMGLPLTIPHFDAHWMFKKHTLMWLAARDNVGKSFVLWYLSTLAAALHGWKALVYAKENRDGAVRKKIKEFYIGKSVKLFSTKEHELAKDFIANHFKFFTSKKMHTASDWLLKSEMIYDEGYEFDVLIGDPYNSFEVPPNENQYTLNLRSLNQLQTFKENYSAVWITDHITSSAARNKNKEGELEVPSKHDVEYGQMKPNKVDDFLVAHRNTKNKEKKYYTEIHVDKIKETETGGCPTSSDEPIMLLANRDLCGFSCNGVDPIKEYWKRKGVSIEEPKTEVNSRLSHRWETNEPAPF